MRKRILVNIVLAFIVYPLVKIVSDYIKIVILHDTRFFLGTFWDFIKMISLPLFIFLPLFFLVVILLPYNLIILNYYKYKNRWLSLPQKMLLFFLIIVVFMVVLGTFENIWYPSWTLALKYLFGFVFYTLIAVISIHYFADVPDQKQQPAVKKLPDVARSKPNPFIQKRIVINIALAFIVCPLDVIGNAFVQKVILHNHSFYAGSVLRFINLHLSMIFSTPLFFLLFIVFSYNLVLLKYYHYKKRWLSLAQKMILFFLIIVMYMVILATFFENRWTLNRLLTLNYFIRFVFYTVFLVIPLHYWVDLPERKMKASAVRN